MAETHRIVSQDPDAVIIDARAYSELDEIKKEVARISIDALRIPFLDGAPLDFKNRNALNGLKPVDFVNDDGFLLEDNVEKIANKIGLDESVVRHVGSAINTVALLRVGYIKPLCNAFIDNEPSIVAKFNDGSHAIPISHEYLANWFRKNHVVGCKISVDSATLNKTIDNYLLFDLDNVNTPDSFEQKVRERNRRFGEISSLLNDGELSKGSELTALLSHNLYANSREIVNLARKTPGFEKTFDEDAGNWEGYKLGEHTETVLDLFDKNYADILPASCLPIMRMALLVHDIGKGEATKNYDKSNQKRYNEKYAEKFLKSNHVDDATTKLIVSMIGDGMNLMDRLIIKGDKSASGDLFNFCKERMAEYFGADKVNLDIMLGFRTMLEVLQACDSAAYTTMAVTRMGEVKYRNYGSFDKSFMPFHGFTGDKVRWLKSRDQKDNKK